MAAQIIGSCMMGKERITEMQLSDNKISITFGFGKAPNNIVTM